ncbi:cache domain-containing sensor histidine kinase [Paenibacillus piri]|uniref:HAMP domain-containing protein n=1 Tax=Paenibacillus piri TaxID=2547395 RepID=A0A4R5KHY4_9BACL|nr:histidine kinase [Paenibacillus piri]TDF95043.1 HAMP domain-containing protein [Paenibacillus piri]
MFKRMETIKLKSQLFIFICISAAIIILIQIVYLSWFEQINQRNYSEFLKDTLKQIELKAVSFSTDIDTIANIIAFNDLTYQFVNTQDIDGRLKLKNSMQVMIESIMLSNKNINDVIVTDLDMIHIGAYRREDFAVLNEVKRRYKEGRLQLDRPAHYVFDSTENDKPFYVCVARSFSTSDNRTNGEFITVVIYNTDSFVNIVSSIQPNDNSLFMLADASGNIIASNRKDAAVNKHWGQAAMFNDHPDGYIGGTGDGKSLAYQRTVRNLDWRVIGAIPDIEIGKDLSALKQFGIVTGIIVVIVLLGFGLMINRSIMRPIVRMAHFMKSIGPNYSTRRLDIRNENEISLLARVMNKMLDNIDEMTREVMDSRENLYQAELAKKHAQFLAFQSQVNPHFLYNTLDCIRSIALARDVAEIFEMTTAMAKIFRYSIKENNHVRVADELGCIQDYFKIIQIRQSNRFALAYDIDDEVMELTIPRMILQPIVENAVFHGLEQKKGPGSLSIQGFMSPDGSLMFEIADDGKGMPPDVLDMLRSKLVAWDPMEGTQVITEKKSIGLMNIDRRIKLLHGFRYGISIASSQQEGTKVSIKLPVMSKNRN